MWRPVVVVALLALAVMMCLPRAWAGAPADAASWLIANSHFRLRLNASAGSGTVGLTVLQLWSEERDSFGANLLLPWNEHDVSRVSGTAVLLAAAPGASAGDEVDGALGGKGDAAEAWPRWVAPSWQPGSSRVTAENDTEHDAARLSLVGAGYLSAPGGGGAVWATEDWTIALAGDTLSFNVNRTYIQAVQAIADRSPALALATITTVGHNSETPGVGLQIPGVLDLAMRTNGSTAFELPVASGAGQLPWWEVVSPEGAAEDVLLSPSRLTLRSAMGGGDVDGGAVLFSMAHPPSDGTTVIAFGREGVNRLAGAGPASLAAGAGVSRPLPPVTAVRRAGQRHSFTWDLRLLQPENAAPAAPFKLTFPSKQGDLTRASAALARQYNSVLGWIMGNNPASTPCLHEMGFFPLMTGLFARAPGDAVNKAMAQQLRLFASPDFVLPSGYVYPRWTVSGPYNATWGPLMDQVPHFLIAQYAHATNTGDDAFLADVMPAIDRVAEFMVGLGIEERGVLLVPGASGLGTTSTKVKCNASNWYDIVCFGHADAYVNAYAVWALDAVAQIKTRVGNHTAAARFTALHARATAAFNAWFWDNDLGFYRDWVDVAGKPHAYLYSDVSCLAIILGIANATQARRVFDAVDARYAVLTQQFGVTRERNMWATPANFYAVRPRDLMYNGTLQDQAEYGQYEDGSAFFHCTGLEVAARGVAGQPEAAWDAFSLMMRSGFNTTALWGASIIWTNATRGAQVLSEPLSDTMMVLWGLVRAGFGVEPTLVHGLRRVSKPLPAMAGASFTFSYLGEDVTLSVNATGDLRAVAHSTASGAERLLDLAGPPQR